MQGDCDELAVRSHAESPKDRPTPDALPFWRTPGRSLDLEACHFQGMKVKRDARLRSIFAPKWQAPDDHRVHIWIFVLIVSGCSGGPRPRNISSCKALRTTTIPRVFWPLNCFRERMRAVTPGDPPWTAHIGSGVPHRANGTGDCENLKDETPVRPAVRRRGGHRHGIRIRRIERLPAGTEDR